MLKNLLINCRRRHVPEGGKYENKRTAGAVLSVECEMADYYSACIATYSFFCINSAISLSS